MTYAPEERSSGPAQAAGLALGAVPRFVARMRNEPPPEQVAFSAMVVMSVGATVAGVVVSTEFFPPVLLTLPLLLGGLLLARKALRALGLVVAVCLLFDTLDLGLDAVRPGALAVVLVTGFIAYEFARSGEETGLGGLRGDAVLLELRRRLELQGDLPPLPAPWAGNSVIRPAGGGPFAGDFVVSARRGASSLGLALVDVSGKGVDAGTRSLLLSGALGGLLGATDPAEFLHFANSYLMRQEWEEGFATAVHLSLDLATGNFAISSAGHPPAAHFDAGSGRWSLLEVGGIALGLLPDATYPQQHGVLLPGDALLLYTDGLVETPGRDLSVGIDKLLGEAEGLVTRGFAGGAEVLVNRVSNNSSDDRGLVLLWRSRQ